MSTFTPRTEEGFAILFANLTVEEGFAISMGLKYLMLDMAGLSCQQHTFTQGSLCAPPCDSSHVGVIGLEPTVHVAGTLNVIAVRKTLQ